MSSFAVTVINRETGIESLAMMLDNTPVHREYSIAIPHSDYYPCDSWGKLIALIQTMGTVNIYAMEDFEKQNTFVIKERLL